jgi:hypothetical protein
MSPKVNVTLRYAVLQSILKDLKSDPGTNTLAYLSGASVTKEKSFMTLAPVRHRPCQGEFRERG